MGHVWLRAETKPFERRTPLLPHHAGILVKNGHQVTIESSDLRIFSDNEYSDHGCDIISAGEWINAPDEAFILGIKELPCQKFSLKHKHLYFAHVYKGQEGAEEILNRFRAGNGTLLDMEFLLDFKQTQLVTKSAGFWAGVCGAAVSLLILAAKKTGETPPFKLPEFYDNYQMLLDDIHNEIKDANKPSVLIIGPNGMTGTGARSLLDKLSLNYTSWTRQETKGSGPFSKILEFDIFLNCIMTETDTAKFITPDILDQNRCLSVIGDISCDPQSPYNPLPIYNEATTFSHSTVRVGSEAHPVDVMAIDHVTTFLPRESSIGLAEQIFPYLCQLLMIKEDYRNTPWQYVVDIFQEHCNA